jgi:hypothetical protein
MKKRTTRSRWQRRILLLLLIRSITPGRKKTPMDQQPLRLDCCRGRSKANAIRCALDRCARLDRPTQTRPIILPPIFVEGKLERSTRTTSDATLHHAPPTQYLPTRLVGPKRRAPLPPKLHCTAVHTGHALWRHCRAGVACGMGCGCRAPPPKPHDTLVVCVCPRVVVVRQQRAAGRRSQAPWASKVGEYGVVTPHGQKEHRTAESRA